MKQDKAVEMESFAESIVAELSAGSPAEKTLTNILLIRIYLQVLLV